MELTCEKLGLENPSDIETMVPNDGDGQEKSTWLAGITQPMADLLLTKYSAPRDKSVLVQFKGKKYAVKIQAEDAGKTLELKLNGKNNYDIYHPLFIIKEYWYLFVI